MIKTTKAYFSFKIFMQERSSFYFLNCFKIQRFRQLNNLIVHLQTFIVNTESNGTNDYMFIILKTEKSSTEALTYKTN